MRSWVQQIMRLNHYQFMRLKDTDERPLPDEKVGEDDGMIDRKSVKLYSCTALIIAVVILSNITTALITSKAWRSAADGFASGQAARGSTAPMQHSKHHETAILEDLPDVSREMKWWTAWGLPDASLHENETYTHVHTAVTDDLWDGIRTDHGMISVDRQWAKEQNWPESMYLPKDPLGKEKAVYLLAGYHQIHCLKHIRKTFMGLVKGQSLEELTFGVGHSMHCFDALRQAIMCQADNSPLYTFGAFTAGDGQVRQCKSWNALREFATQNSACYRDGDAAMPLQDHFGFCEEGMAYQDGQDGLP